MCKKRETLIYKVSLGFNDLFFTKFKHIEFRTGCRRRCRPQAGQVRPEFGGAARRAARCCRRAAVVPGRAVADIVVAVQAGSLRRKARCCRCFAVRRAFSFRCR
jgi:hypothetical protein